MRGQNIADVMEKVEDKVRQRSDKLTDPARSWRHVKSKRKRRTPKANVESAALRDRAQTLHHDLGQTLIKTCLTAAHI